ncbi:BTB/POZ and MATH domain-containing protein 2-like [Lolium rigidum]|uniref:BTB/POZ and MATH domain-containing protein 2-like n=1 Tax=Lolium rigidum TaxID=89674 RepID=UPI001F5E230D|nr:BTB/POZ and MATH domain-containing protein 2-like [Lolium rigidum]
MQAMSPYNTVIVTGTVTTTARGTHVFDIGGFNSLTKGFCGVDGFVYSPTFTVDGLDWAIRYYPDGDHKVDQGYASIFVELVTKDAAAWARVSFGLIDGTTGEVIPLYHSKDSNLFDSSYDETSNWGTGELVTRIPHLQAGSQYVLGNRLRIDCAIHVCRDHLTFRDDPSAALTHCSEEEPTDVTLDVAGVSFDAHESVLHARAPAMMKHLRYTTTVSHGKLRVSVDDIPPASFKALLHFAYTDSLPVLSGLNGAGHKEMLRCLLIAAQRYGMERLKAICERVLSNSIDVDTVASTLAMAEQHGFSKLREACVEFNSFSIEQYKKDV